MSLGRWFGPLAAVGLVGIFACSSSSGGALASDAGDDSGLIHRTLDGGGGDADVAIVGDGTSGKTCAKDAECSNGPGVNKCSLGLEGTFNGVTFELWTTPICIVPLPTSSGNCDPAPLSDPNGFQIHYCDGPDEATSPGHINAQLYRIQSSGDGLRQLTTGSYSSIAPRFSRPPFRFGIH